MLYDEGAELCNINSAVKKMTDKGESVIAQKAKPQKLRYKRLVKLCGMEVEEIENNA